MTSTTLPVAEFPQGFIDASAAARKRTYPFLWATNCHFTPKTVTQIANHGGRLRWKVENEGFNAQKNEGYGMAHRFSEHSYGARNFYLLLLIAHYICQLILHGSLIKTLVRTFGSAKNFARRLAESLRLRVLPDNLTLPDRSASAAIACFFR